MGILQPQQDKSTNSSPEIEVSIEDSAVDPGTGQKFVDIVIQSDDITLIENSVNLIDIGLVGGKDQSTDAKEFVKETGNPVNMIAALTAGDKNKKARSAGNIDPKESVAHGDIAKISNGVKVEEIEEIRILSFKSKPYGRLPDVNPEQAFMNIRNGQPMARKKGPALISRETLQTGLITNSQGKIKPEIIKRTTQKNRKKSTKRIRVVMAPHESVELNLLNKDNQSIKKIDSGSQKKDLVDAELAKYEHPKTLGFFRSLVELDELMAVGLRKEHNRYEVTLDIQTRSKDITGIAIYQREITEHPILDEFDLIKKVEFDKPFKVTPRIKIRGGNPIVFRVVPLLWGIEAPTFQDIIYPGEVATSESVIICYYQTLAMNKIEPEVIIQFHKIPVDAKKMEVYRTDQTTNSRVLVSRQNVVQYQQRKASGTRPLYKVTDQTGRLNTTYFYEIFSVNKWGTRKAVKNFTLRIYNKSPHEPKILSFKLDAKVTNAGFVHFLSGEISFHRPWIPKGDESLEVPTDNIVTSALNGLRLCKIEIIRFDHFGNKENLGIFTLNPGHRISEIESELTPQKTIKFSLDVDQIFIETRNLNPTREDIYYYYIVRPIDYPLSNELSFLNIPIKLEYPPRNGKTGFSYDPFVFNSPMVRETGINPSMMDRSRHNLYAFGAHAVSAVANSYVPRKTYKPIGIKAFPIAFHGDDPKESKARPEIRHQIKELYTHLIFDIPVYYLDLVDHFEIWAAPSSTGKYELLNRFYPSNSIVEYLDFETPALATNGIRYLVRGLDYRMQELVSSRPIDIDLEEILGVKNKNR